MSDAVQLTHPRILELVRYLGEQRAHLVAAARAVPADGWSERLTRDGWSPAEIIDHLRIVEHGTVRLFQKLIGEARAAGHPAESDTTSVMDEAFTARVLDRSIRIEAPPRVMPTRAPDLESGLAAMQAERASLLAALVAADGLALGSLIWPHPVLGQLDLYKWLMLLAAHEGRHAAQLREMTIAFAPRD